jgi:hypothetical protein
MKHMLKSAFWNATGIQDREGAVNAFRTAFRVYTYLAALFTICLWTFMVIDDYSLTSEYWDEAWMMYIGIWFAYYLVYLLGVSFYYWSAMTIGIVVYFRFIAPKKKA